MGGVLGEKQRNNSFQICNIIKQSSRVPKVEKYISLKIDIATDFFADSLIINENCKSCYHIINGIHIPCLWTNLNWLEQCATVWGSAMVSWWTWLKWGTIHEHICGHIGPYWAAPVWKMWWRACWVQTVQDFLIKLGIKPLMHLLEKKHNDLVRLTKIMNNHVKDFKIMSFKVLF